jgi:hypothetical protein
MCNVLNCDARCMDGYVDCRRSVYAQPPFYTTCPFTFRSSTFIVISGSSEYRVWFTLVSYGPSREWAVAFARWAYGGVLKWPWQVDSCEKQSVVKIWLNSYKSFALTERTLQLDEMVTSIINSDITPSMEQSPSWEANRFSASEEIRILWNPKVRRRVNKIPPRLPLLGQISRVHVLPSCFLRPILLLYCRVRLFFPGLRCALKSGRLPRAQL